MCLCCVCRLRTYTVMHRWSIDLIVNGALQSSWLWLWSLLNLSCLALKVCTVYRLSEMVVDVDPQPSQVTCSNGPRLCGWRTISEELFWCWEWTPCNYDLAACADCPPSGRIADNPHFPFLLTICSFRLNPLVSSFPPELSNSVFFLDAAHNSNSSDQQPSLLLFSEHSQVSRCPYGGSVTMPGCSTLKCGRTYVLYSVKNCLLLITLKFLYIIPSQKCW